MLSVFHSLFFPELVYDRDVHMASRSTAPIGSGSHQIQLFRLDWTKMESALLQKHKDWQAQILTKSDKWNVAKKQQVQFVPGLPQPYLSIVDGFKFALNANSIKEIRRCVRCAFDEYQIIRPFDTGIRDMLLNPAISYISCAFKLLTDCLFDEVTNRWSRKIPLKMIASQAMLYRFWSHQTGSGLVREHADLDRLREVQKWTLRSTDETEETCRSISSFLESIAEHEKLIRQNWDQVAVSLSTEESA